MTTSKRAICDALVQWCSTWRWSCACTAMSKPKDGIRNRHEAVVAVAVHFVSNGELERAARWMFEEGGAAALGITIKPCRDQACPCRAICAGTYRVEAA